MIKKNDKFMFFWFVKLILLYNKVVLRKVVGKEYWSVWGNFENKVFFIILNF